jgi:hypothetical protein
MRDLLECVWPAALDTAQQPFRSNTWIAALMVIAERDGGDLARTRRLGAARFEHALRDRSSNRVGRNPACASSTSSSPRRSRTLPSANRMDFAHARFDLLTHLLRNISITISTGVKESNDAGTSARTMNGVQMNTTAVRRMDAQAIP